MGVETQAQKLSKSAIIVGALTDVLGSIALGLTIGMIISTIWPPDAGHKGLTVGMFVFSIIAGFFMDGVGGFVAASMSGYRMRSHALWTGVLVWCFGLITSTIPTTIEVINDPSKLWTLENLLLLLSMIFVIPCAYAGGRVAELLVRKRGRTLDLTGITGGKAQSIFTWSISDQELKEQTERYGQLSLSQSYRGRVIIFFIGIFAYSLIAIPLISPSMDPYVAIFGSLLYSPFLYFSYYGNRIGLWGLLIFWTYDKFFTVIILSSNSTQLTVGLSVALIVWALGSILIAKAIRLENIRRKAARLGNSV